MRACGSGVEKGDKSAASQGRFAKFLKQTGREKFLEEMERIMPWAELERSIEPHFPKESTSLRPWD